MTRNRTATAKAELSVDRRGMTWRLADAKAATNRRGRARKAKTGTVFTSDPQSLAPTYSYTGTTRAQ